VVYKGKLLNGSLVVVNILDRKKCKQHRIYEDEEEDGDEKQFTIQDGSGRVTASKFAANFDAKVAIRQISFSTISYDNVGGVSGTCVLHGCVLKNLLVYSSKFSHEFEESRGFGWYYECEPKIDWTTQVSK